ncbi:ankyrin repeat-containing domain protein, partial [Coniochaeta sp. 2T2.1]
SALHLAASLGHVEIVQFLLAQIGTDIDAKDDNGRTPLHEAAEAGHEVVVGVLYEGGANLELRESDEKSAADLAVAGGHLPVLEKLNEKGADFGRLPGNAVLLHAAASREDLPMMKFLLDAGIHPDARFSGLTPSMRTLHHQSLDALQMLLKAGAKAEARTPSGISALHAAIENSVRGGDEEIISVLLGAGARIHDRERDGLNAAELCGARGRPDLSEII